MAIQALRLPNGEELVFDEWSHWFRYSSADVAAAAAGNFNLQLFSYVVGGRVPQAGGVAARQATPSDTNQIAKKRMNQDEAFLAYAWTYEVFGLSSYIAGTPATNLAAAPIFSAVNLRRLQRDVVASLFVGAQIRKPVARSPLSWIGMGAGSPAYGNGPAPAVNVAVMYGTAGRPTPANQRNWSLPINIDSDRVYSLGLQGLRSPGVGSTPALDAVTQNFTIRFTLDGLHRRPIA